MTGQINLQRAESSAAQRAISTPKSQDRPYKRPRSSSPSRGNEHAKRRAVGVPSKSALLLSLPGLLAVPPNHRASVSSYGMSLLALRKCIALGNLSPDEECRAWTGIAELGLRLVKAGWTKDDKLSWAKSLNIEVRLLYFCLVDLI
jgi:hypothetical protein